MGERLICIQEVSGSIPLSSTIRGGEVLIEVLKGKEIGIFGCCRKCKLPPCCLKIVNKLMKYVAINCDD
jgi:hypothetical protein